MRKSLQELLDYAEGHLEDAAKTLDAENEKFHQQQSLVASQLAIAVAMASAVKYDKESDDN